MFLAVVLVLLTIDNANGEGMAEFLPQSRSTGTQNNLNLNVSYSDLPHLPTMHGYMGTHATYRFLSIIEQTAWLVGEPKHGMWRYQESGLIREFRKKGSIGLRDGDNPNDANLDARSKDIINSYYSHFIKDESWDGYKTPTDRISSGDGSYDDQQGFLNYIDLSIYHPKYNGKYNNHVPVDMPLFYCTMTQNDYPHVYNSWKYAVAQPLANKIGPLGIRAGLDIKELYENVIQFDLIHDAGIWVNVGNNDPNGGDLKITNDPTHIQNVNYQRVSFDKMNIETYLVERAFFNKPYLFIIAIMENKNGASEYSYVRNNGPYWDGLVQRNLASSVTNHVAKTYLKAFVDNYPSPGVTSERKVYGLPVYGVHNPDRAKHRMTGGACPERGGDWSTYPWGNSGGAFPTNYQEITPICDAIVIDMKLAANLWVETWNDPKVGNANSAYQTELVEYTIDKNIYGQYTDPYLIKNNVSNPSKMDLTNGQIIEPEQKTKQSRVTIKLRFTHLGRMIDFNRVKGLRSNKKPNNCPIPPTCPPAKVSPTCPPVQKCPDIVAATTDDPTHGPRWGHNILVIVCVILALMLVELIVIIFICDRVQRNRVYKKAGEARGAKTNPTFDNTA